MKNESGVLRVDPVPSDEELSSYYHDKYYQDHGGQYVDSYTDSQIDYFNFEDKILHFALKEKFNFESGKLLEFGSGEGHTLSFFQKKGWAVYGVDFSDYGLKQHQGDKLDSFKFYKGSFLDCDIFPEEKFDVVVLKHVLEHVSDVDKTLESCKEKLNPGGCLYVIVPNDYSIIQSEYIKEHSLSSEECPWFLPPEHLSYFSVETLETTMAKFGFSSVDMLGDFPIDIFTLNNNFDYYKNKTGKDAHDVRVKYINLISQNIPSAYNLCKANMAAGLGRSILGVFRNS